LDAEVGEVVGFAGLAVVVVVAEGTEFEVVRGDIGRRYYYWGSIGLGILWGQCIAWAGS
jgi:hypothetical protein